MPNPGSVPEEQNQPKYQTLGIFLLVINLFAIQGIFEIVPGYLNRAAWSIIFTSIYWTIIILVLPVPKPTNQKPL